MSVLLNKIKETKKANVPIKTSVELETADAKAYKELLTYVGEKELLAVALEDPASLEKLLDSKHKEKVQINKSVELNESQDDALKALKDKYPISEIMAVAIQKLNPRKELKAIKASLKTENQETQTTETVTENE